MSFPIPDDVTRVEGCTCGGLDWHAEGCSIWRIDFDRRQAVVADAKRRISEWRPPIPAALDGEEAKGEQ